jgi:hypothetical protein
MAEKDHWEAVTFFEKKGRPARGTKKTFGSLRAACGPHAVHTPREAKKKFFASFFQKRSSCLLSYSPVFLSIFRLGCPRRPRAV